MGRAPCCDKEGVKKGPWTSDEDQKLVDYIKRNGHGSWRTLPKRAGLLRCGKSCRLRWINYLRPDIKRGKFSFEEEQTIIQLHSIMGNKWSAIAASLPGRTDNEIKNFWNSNLRKRLLRMGIDPVTHRPSLDLFNFGNISSFLGSAGLSCMSAEWENARLREAMMREYHLRITSATRGQEQQEACMHDPNTGAVNAADILMRSQMGSSFSMPDFTSNSIMSQVLGQNSQNWQKSLEYNTLIARALQQLQFQSQTMNNLHHLSPTSTLDGLSTQLEYQAINSKPSHSAPVINSETTAIPAQNSNPQEAYENLLNSWKLMSQPCPKTHDGSSSLALDTSIMWPENHLFGICKSDAESDLPSLRSSTSSPGLFHDPDLVSETSSSMANMNVNSSSTFGATCDGSYGVPLEFLLNAPEASNQKEKIAMENFECDQVYWRNMLESVAEGCEQEK